MPTMKNHATPRTLADCDFRVGTPIIPKRRARYHLETAFGAAVILALVILAAWAITGA